jgi:hypothetical protein
MRKFVLPLVAASAAIAMASPVSAQPYPAPGYGYGFGQVRALQVRIDNVERQINRLDRRDRIGDRNADRLRDDANRIEDRLHRAARGGLRPYEARDIEYRIQRLEQRVQYAMNYRYGDHDRWDRDRRDRD